MSCELRYRPSPDVPWIYVKFPEGTDPFAVCNRARERIFPDVKMIPASSMPRIVVEQKPGKAHARHG